MDKDDAVRRIMYGVRGQRLRGIYEYLVHNMGIFYAKIMLDVEWNWHINAGFKSR